MQAIKSPPRRPVEQILLPLEGIDVSEKHSHQERSEQQAEGDDVRSHPGLIRRAVSVRDRQRLRRSQAESRRKPGKMSATRAATDSFDRVTPNGHTKRII